MFREKKHGPHSPDEKPPECEESPNQQHCWHDVFERKEGLLAVKEERCCWCQATRVPTF